MNPLNIVADQNMRGVERYFQHLGRVRMIEGRAIRAADLSDTDLLLVRSVTTVNEALLAQSKLRFVGTATSGFDHIDRAFLRENNIGFSHAPGSNANSVVEYVLCAIARVEDKLERLLTGGTIGIIGYGNIGRALAARCTALGATCKVYDPWLDSATFDHYARPVKQLADVLACEVVSVHAELTHKSPWPSYHLLGERELALIPESSMLINAGRGELVDNAALLSLKREGRGPLVVLDVWEDEPNISAQLLDCVELGTAHIAGYSYDGKLLATQMLHRAALRHFNLEDDIKLELAELPEVLTAPPGLSDAQLCRWAVNARYDIGEDDALLRGAVTASGTGNSAEAFDKLRKSYRRRREMKASRVECEPGAGQERILEALGCSVDPAVRL